MWLKKCSWLSKRANYHSVKEGTVKIILPCSWYVIEREKIETKAIVSLLDITCNRIIDTLRTYQDTAISHTTSSTPVQKCSYKHGEHIAILYYRGITKRIYRHGYRCQDLRCGADQSGGRCLWNGGGYRTILLVSVCQYRFYVEITWKKSVREVSEREMWDEGGRRRPPAGRSRTSNE